MTPPEPNTTLAPLPASRRGRLAEVALLFARLGFTSFGGPAVHTALMEDEVVRRRRWLDREHFLDLVGSLNFIPGPNSTELAIHLGLIRAGLPGLVVAGACFIAPAVLIILPIAWAYVHYAGGGSAGGAGVRPPPAAAGALAGIGAVVVAVLAVAARRFAAAAFKSRFTLVVAGLTVGADFLLRHPDLWLGGWPALRDAVAGVQSEIVILLGAGVAGAIAAKGKLGAKGERADPAGPSSTPAADDTVARKDDSPGRSRAGFVPVGAMHLLSLGTGPAAEMARLGWYFLTVGATLFGSGYVLVSYLETGLVHKLHWLTQQQLADAIAVGQVTPGPLLTTATFVGYFRGYQVTGGSDWGGVVGGLVATAGIFGPSFVLVAAFGRVLPALRRQPWARGALDAMNAAVVALLLLVTLRFAAGLQVDGRPDLPRVALAVASLGLMLRWNVNPTWLIVGGAMAGAAAAAAGG